MNTCEEHLDTVVVYLRGNCLLCLAEKELNNLIIEQKEHVCEVDKS